MIFNIKSNQTNKLFLFTVILYGFTGTLTQILQIREFMNFFNSNELVLGLFFSMWMLFVSLGAWTGRIVAKLRSHYPVLFITQFLMGALPILSVLFLRYFRIHYILAGKAVALDGILIALILSLFLFCFVSGFLFTFLCDFRAHFNKYKNISYVYYIETIGSVLAGLLFGFILVYIFSTFQILRVILFLNVLCLFFWGYLLKRKTVYVVAFLMIIFSMAIFYFEMDISSKKDFFKGQKIIQDSETPYGNITVTEAHEQINVFQNGFLAYSSGDYMNAEEIIHHTMFRHVSPKSVLLISGGISGSIYELLKYKDLVINYLETNKFIVDLGLRYHLIPDTGISIHVMDPVLFLKTSNEKYDVIIVDMPDPSNTQINRYYTFEFFTLLKEHLNSDGIISTSLSGTAQYMNAHARVLNSVVYNTLKRVFNHIIIVNGGRNFFIVSDTELSYSFIDSYIKKGIETAYVNPFYFDEKELFSKGQKFTSELIPETYINTDFHPVVYMMQNKYWLSFSNHSIYIIAVIIAVIMILMIFRFNAINLCLFTGGFASTGMQMIFILTLQVLYGFIYSHISFLIAVFMGGLALGAYLINNVRFKIITKHFFNVQLFISAASFLYALLIIMFQKYSNNLPAHILVYTFTFVFAVLTGMEFSMSTFLMKSQITLTASALYSADLLGASLGAIVVGVFLIPLIGIINTCFVIAILNLLSGFYLKIFANFEI